MLSIGAVALELARLYNIYPDLSTAFVVPPLSLPALTLTKSTALHCTALVRDVCSRRVLGNSLCSWQSFAPGADSIYGSYMYLHNEGTCHVSDDFVPRLALWTLSTWVSWQWASKREPRIRFERSACPSAPIHEQAQTSRQCQTSRQADKRCRQGPVGQAPAR